MRLNKLIQQKIYHKQKLRKLEKIYHKQKQKNQRKYLLVYAQYLENFANNMNFASFQDDYKNLKELSKYIKDNVENINLWGLKAQFNEKLWAHSRFTEWFKDFIQALKDENIQDLKQYEQNIIFTLRSIDQNDGLINWNYEMPIYDEVEQQTEQEILSEDEQLKQIFKQIENLQKSDPSQFIKLYENLPSKYEWHGHGRKKVKDLTKLNDFLNTLLWDYKPELIEKTLKKFEKFYKNYQKEKHKYAEELAEKILENKKAEYYYDENMIERPNPNYDKMKKETIKQIEENLTKKEKTWLWIKLFDILKQELISDKISNKKQVSKIQDLYSQMNGLRWYTSDETEEKIKFWTKEVLIQTAMMIPAIRIADLGTIALSNIVKKVETKAGEKMLETAFWRQVVNKTVNGTIFTEAYNVEDTFRIHKEDLLDKDGNPISKWGIFVEKFKDTETLAKNIIMLWWLRFLHENKLIIRKWKYDEIKWFGIQTVEEWEKWMIYGLEEKIGQKIENKYISYVSKKAIWVWLETGVIYSIGSLENVVLGEDILTQEDTIFGLAMVISLRASWKLLKPAENKALLITKKMIDSFRLKNLKEKFPLKWIIENKKILEIIQNKEFLKEIINKLLEKFKQMNLKTILSKKDQRDVNSFLTILIHKELWIKANEKLKNEDKRRIKYILKEIKIRLWDINQNKWEQGQWGNGESHWYIPETRFGETIKVKWWEKLIWEIIKWLQEKWANLREEKTIKYVEDLIKKLVDKKFKEAEKNHKVVEIDKELLIKDLMWKYNQLVREIEKVWDTKTINEKINKLADNLEKLDKLEYQEIIDALRDKVEGKESEGWNDTRRD